MRPWHVGMAAAGFLLAGGAAPLTAQGPPNAPVNLEADVTPESVFLTWEADNSGNRRTAVSFRIYRDDERIGTSSNEEYFDSDVDDDEEYTYQVSGVDNRGREGDRSAPLTVYVPDDDQDDDPPDEPDNLVAVAVSASRIDLQWDAVDDDDDEPTVVGYYIYRDGGSSPHDSTGATQYSDTGLAAFTVYTYRVSAVTSAGVEGDLSDPASARTLDGSPPSAPQGVTAEATGPQSIELAWNAAQDPESGVSAYRVYRGGSLLGTSAGLGYVDLTVEPNTTYAYEVSAVNGVGLESARASAPPVTTPNTEGPGDTAPDQPDNLVAEAVSASRIDLQWDAVGEDDDESAVVGYRIYRNGGNAPHASTGAPQYSDTGLAAFTEYTYRISAVTAGGVEGELSDPATARTLDGSPPSAPSNVTAQAPGARFVELTWNAASDPESGISLYLVYRDGGAIPIDSTTATAYADGTVEPETSYAYRVAARNGVGLEGAKSAQVNVTTPAATDQSPPSVPGDFTAEAVSADRVELTWSDADDPESGISAYRVYRDDALLGTSPGIGYVDLTVEPNTTYEYEVSAVNGDGLEGARASAPPVTTPDAVEGPGDTVPPAPPTDLRVITG